MTSIFIFLYLIAHHLFHYSSSSLKTLEDKVYSGSSTLGGQPMLSPQTIVDSLVQLDSLMKKLEQTVMDIIKDIDSKKKVRNCWDDALSDARRAWKAGWIIWSPIFNFNVTKACHCSLQALRSDTLQVTERKLFVYFFNNPDRLRRALDEVSSRLQAQLVTWHGYRLD